MDCLVARMCRLKNTTSQSLLSTKYPEDGEDIRTQTVRPVCFGFRILSEALLTVCILHICTCVATYRQYACSETLYL